MNYEAVFCLCFIPCIKIFCLQFFIHWILLFFQHILECQSLCLGTESAAENRQLWALLAQTYTPLGKQLQQSTMATKVSAAWISMEAHTRFTKPNLGHQKRQPNRSGKVRPTE